MNASRRMLPVFAGVALSLLLMSASASAAPITVNLRVEGSTKTLYEGPITTEPRTIEAPEYISKGTFGPTQPHPCDVNENGEYPAGSFGASYGTPTSALYGAAQSLGLTFDAYWYPSFNDFFVNGIGSEETEDWGYAVDYTTASVGGCQFQLAPGSEVLWSATFAASKHLLELSGPATTNVGSPITVHVIDGQTGEPISGAAIGELVSGVTNTSSSSPTTNAAGNATVTLTHVGTATLKATQSESVRSNGLAVCVHNGEDGTCGTQVPLVTCADSLSLGDGLAHEACAPPPRLPPYSVPTDLPRVTGIANGRVFRGHHGPRVLQGDVEVLNGGTLRQVKISLQRRYRGRCFDFSGSRESFVRTKKCGAADFFSVGGSESFSYLLPARLPKGSYTYDIEAINSTGQATKLVSGVSHVVFKVG
jgi:hypothetical protein